MCGTFIHGILGMSCERVRSAGFARTAGGPALEKGPAFGDVTAAKDAAQGWPTWRHDASRSGVCDAVIAPETSRGVDVSRREAGSAAPVAADGKALFASRR